MPTLLLDNFLDTKYSKWFSRYHSDELETFRAPEGRFPEDLTRYDHAILSGSEDSVVEDRDWVDTEMELIRELARLKIPTLGLCYGHQLIARALIGPEAVRRTLTPEFGWIEIILSDMESTIDGVASPTKAGSGREAALTMTKTPTEPGRPARFATPSPDALMAGLPPRFHAFNSHFDEVAAKALAADGRFRALATSAGCAVQAFGVKEAPIWGIQFHPEISITDGVLFLRDIAEYVAGAGFDVEEAMASRARAAEGVSRRLFGNFYGV